MLSTGAQALTQASFGEGTGRIWLNNVQCTASERVLINCTASSSGNTCTHSQDAGVRCATGEKDYLFLVSGGREGMIERKGGEKR